MRKTDIGIAMGLGLALAAAGCATAGAGDDDTSGDDDDIVFVDASNQPGQPDASNPLGIDGGGGTCPTSPCDLVQQCGCTSPTVCDLDLANLPATACRSVTTPGVEGSACTDLPECAGGYVCVDGSCSRYCATDADCGSPRRKCVVTLASGMTEIPGAVTCSSACEPPNAASGGLCPAGFSCYLAFLDPDGSLPGMESGDEIPFATCGQAGTAIQGQACATNSDCALNHLCVNTGTTTCLRMCTVSTSAECTTGTCIGLIPAMVIGGTEYGVCN